MIIKCCLGAAALYLLSRITGRDAEILKSAIRVQQLKDLGELLQTDGKVSPLIIAVTGSVASETPIKCEHSDILAVFVEETAEQHFLKRNWKFSWVQDSALIKPITKQVPWHLDDGTGRVNVAGAQGAIGFTLTAGNEVFEKSETPSSLVRRTLDYLQGHKMLGVKRMEHTLPIGTQLTVVGEAVKDSIGDVRIQEPEGGPFYVSHVPLDELISKLGEFSRWFKYASMGLAFVGAALISKRVIEYFLVRIRYTLARRRQLQQQQQEYEQRQQQYQQQQLEQQQHQQRDQQQQIQQYQQRQQQRQLEIQRQLEQQRQLQRQQLLEIQRQLEQQRQLEIQRQLEQQLQLEQQRQLEQQQQRQLEIQRQLEVQRQLEQQRQQRQQQVLSVRRDLDEAAATRIEEPVCRGSERQHENSSDGNVSDLCVICLDQKSDHAFVNCGHMCCCRTCAFKLQNKNCPMCRTPINQVLKIYRS